MKCTPFDRYFWLLNTLRITGGATRSELDRLWHNSDVNTKNEDHIPNSTFFHWVKMIKRQWGINVLYSSQTGKYYVDEMDDENIFTRWIMNSISVTEMIRNSSDLHERILLERMPGGERWLNVMIFGMRENRVLDMSYKPFDVGMPHVMTFKPYCLKTFKQRWYVVGESSNHPGETRVYALDRIVGLSTTETEFALPEGFDGEALFRDLYGIWLGTDLKVERVRVRVTEREAFYLRTLALHHSQREVGPSETEGWVEFEWMIKPTYDFIMELRSRGRNLKVIAPKWLAKEV